MSQVLARYSSRGQGLPELGDPLLEEYLQFVDGNTYRVR